MITLFSKSRELEAQTDEFCDKLSEGVLAFRIGINAYFNGDTEAFIEKKKHVSEVESRGDELRREIQRRLYAETLLPESRGDVLELLETSDHILNACESGMWQFAIETPDFDAKTGAEFRKLVEAVVASAEHGQLLQPVQLPKGSPLSRRDARVVDAMRASMLSGALAVLGT